jgi:hypothetical protein
MADLINIKGVGIFDDVSLKEKIYCKKGVFCECVCVCVCVIGGVTEKYMMRVCFEVRVRSIQSKRNGPKI